MSDTLEKTTDSNEVHPANASSSIVDTDYGIVTAVNAVHLENALLPIVLTFCPLNAMRCKLEN